MISLYPHLKTQIEVKNIYKLGISLKVSECLHLNIAFTTIRVRDNADSHIIKSHYVDHY